MLLQYPHFRAVCELGAVLGLRLRFSDKGLWLDAKLQQPIHCDSACLQFHMGGSTVSGARLTHPVTD